MRRQRKLEWPNEKLGDLINLLAAQGRKYKNASQRQAEGDHTSEKAAVECAWSSTSTWSSINLIAHQSYCLCSANPRTS